jgi:acetyltransferase-like isoleucine patch superfamily enzyme
MKEYFKKIRLDASGYIFSHCQWMAYNINRTYYSFYMRISLNFKGIKIGRSTIFYNKARFNRYPESRINIGNCCVFDSAKYHNLIGVDKCCLISTMSKDARLQIGNSSGFSGVRIGCAEKITIGNNCLIGANVLITDTDWHSLDPAKRMDAASTKTKPVKIGNNVFIGINSIVLKGTEIGDNSVIGAGSVASGIIPPNVVAAGNPCKVIKTLH